MRIYKLLCKTRVKTRLQTYKFYMLYLMFKWHVAILNYEEDVAMYTIKVANDPRTCNRVAVYRPSKNFITQNELISLWERKKAQHFNKVFISEDEIIKLSQSKTSAYIPYKLLLYKINYTHFPCFYFERYIFIF